MKLSEWARRNGLDYKTAYRMFKAGTFPRPCEQLPTGTILVHEVERATNNAVLYARVSSGDQKTDLERQMQRLRDYAATQGLKIVGEVSEIGSGLNGHRKALLKLLANPSVSVIVVEHRDRLMRFGADYVSAALSSCKREVRVLNESECEDDLVRDMVDVLTSFCARLYGRRSAKNRAKKALEAAQSC